MYMKTKAKKTQKRLKKYYKRKTRKYTGMITRPKYDNALTICNTVRQRPMKFKRSILNLSIPQPTSGGPNYYPGRVAVQFNQIPGYTELTGVFAEYRITKVGATIRMTDALTAGLQQPTIYMWKDKLPSDLPSSWTISQVGQFGNLRKYTMSDEHRQVSLVVKPYLLENVLVSGTGGTVYNYGYNRWIPTGYPSASYYAIGYAVENFVDTSVGAINLELDIEVEFECRTQI